MWTNSYIAAKHNYNMAGLSSIATCMLLLFTELHHIAGYGLPELPRDQVNEPKDIVQKEIFTSGEGGYYCFRIPSVLFTSKGTLLAFAEGRGQHTQSCADHGDVHLVLKRSSDEGETWSNLTVVYSEYPKHTIGNPAPVEDKTSGKILLLFCRDNKQVLQMESVDDGVTWGSMVDITEMVVLTTWGFVGTGPPGGIQLPSGRLIIGAYASGNGGPGSFSIFSDNGGKTWNRSKSTSDTSTGECQVVHLGLENPDNTKLAMATRTHEGHYFFYSNDSGESWHNVSLPSSLNPQTVCQSSLLAIPYQGATLDTHLYITQPHATSRMKMTFFHSTDIGKTWKSAYELWDGPSGYSSMAYYKLRVFCLYEKGKSNYWETLTLAIFPPLI